MRKIAFNFRVLVPIIQNLKLEVGLRERQSIFESTLHLREQRRWQTAQPLDDAPLVDRFDLLSDHFGGVRETGGPLRYHDVTRREPSRVFGQRNNHGQLAVLIDAVVGQNDCRPSFF